MALFGGIEAGGTKFVVGIGDACGGSRATARIPTTTPDETIAAVVAFFRAQSGEGPLAAIGIGAFGPVELDPSSPDYGQILTTPKLGWAGTDLRGRIAAATGVAVGIETDVNAAAIAEARVAGVDDLAYVTVGTGVGVGLFAGGRPVHGRGHPELGHFRPRRHALHGDFAGICPYHGDCLEGLISGPAIAAAWGAPLDRLAPDHPARVVVADYVAQLCATILLATAPARIVIGGGVMADGNLFPAIRRTMSTLVAGYIAGADADALGRRVTPPACVEPSGLIGAYLVAEAAR